MAKANSATPTVSSGLGHAATSGFIWLFAQSLCARLSGLLSQLVLAWLLRPSDFGLIGLAYSVTLIAQSLIGFGVDDVLMQRQKRIAQWSSSAFWISFCLGTLGMLALLIAAPIAAHVYRSNQLTWIILTLAAAMPLQTLSTVPTVNIRLAMDFRFLASYNAIEILVIQALTILFAWQGFGALSFALPVPVMAATKAVLYWRRSPPIYRKRLRRVQVLYMLSRSFTVFLTRTIIVVVSQGDYMVLGVVASKYAVGLYYFAFRLSVQPIRMLSGNFINVLLPAFSQLTGQHARQIDAVMQTCRMLAYVVVPFCFLQAALAEPGLTLLFGQRWHEAIPLVELLSVGLPFDAVSWITGSLLTARREFGRALRFAAFSVPVLFGLVITGSKLDGVVGVASAVVVYYTLYPPICSVLILRSEGVRIGALADLYLVPLVLAGVSNGVAILVAWLPMLAGHELLRVVVISAVSGLMYLGLLYAFRRDMLRQIQSRFAGPIRKLRNSRLRAA